MRKPAGRGLAATAPVAVSILSVLAGRAAHAQAPSLLERYFPDGVPGYGAEAGVTVPSRLRPEYEPLGVRAGSFIIRPEITESLGYASNPAGLTKARGSGVWETQGALAANSDWGRNSL